MDLGSVQPAGTGLGNTGVNPVSNQPGPYETGISHRQLIQAVKAVNGAELFGDGSELTFVFDRQTHRALVRVVNKDTREVILQIPAENVLRMAQEGKAR
jgi:uncharacterized FlaG/YvyC family protein